MMEFKKKKILSHRNEKIIMRLEFSITFSQAPGNMGPPFSPHHGPPANMNTHPDGSMPLEASQDNGISSSGSSTSSQHPVTSIVTTGPDGTPIDEASQQSTISNASAGMYLIIRIISLKHLLVWCYGFRTQE